MNDTLTVWKQPIEILDTQTLMPPAGARVLCVETQSFMPFIWYLCDPKAALTPRIFLLTGTGHVRTDLSDAAYIGTFQLNGALVFHLFERAS